ncbi:MAG: hypothetical protein ABJG88_13410 [Litorimonas sp.]
MSKHLFKKPKDLYKGLLQFSMASIAAALVSSPALAQTSFTLNQASDIPNGLKICDSTDKYCIDIVADLSNSGALLPNAVSAGAGSFNDRQNDSDEHTKLDYTVSSTNSVGGPAQPFRFDALSLLGINSLTGNDSPNLIRDSYTFIEGGAWRVDNPATGDIHAASVSINTAAADDVGSFVIPDPEGNNVLGDIGSFQAATALGVGNNSEVLLNMTGGEDGHNATYTFDTPQISSASLIVFNSGGRRMGWGYDTLLQVDIFAPELTSTKSFGTPVINADGTVTVPVTIIVENTGETPVNSLQVMDNLSAPSNFGSAFQSIIIPPSISVIDDGNIETAVAPSANASTFNGSSQPLFLGGSNGLLGVDDRLQITFTALLDPNANGAPTTLQNLANVSGVGPLGENLAVDTIAPGNGTSSPTPLSVPVANPSLSMKKVADNQGPHNVGDVVTYTYTVRNDGDVSIANVAISDTHNGSDPAPTPGNETLLTDVGTQGDSTDSGIDGSWDFLAPGDVLTFTGTYTVTQIDVDNL